MTEGLTWTEQAWKAEQAAERFPDTDLDPSLEPVDLAEVLTGSMTQPTPDYLHRSDGAGLFYAGAINGIHSDSGTGKSWIVCQLIRDNARRGQRTLLLDFEDTAQSITARLLLLGMTAHDIETWLVYVRPQVPLGPAAVDHLLRLVELHNVPVVVIDSIGEAFALEGVNEDRDVEVGPWLRRVARPLADTGAAVVLVDHSTKAGDSPLHPSGSKRKRAAITGASYLVEAVAPFVKGQGGRLRLTCAKDRHGNYRRGENVADLVMVATAEGVQLDLFASTITTDDDTTLPVLLAAKAAVEAAKAEGGTLSRNALEGLMKHRVKARAEIKRGGIDLAVNRGALQEERKGNARLYSYLTDLDNGTRPDSSGTRPTNRQTPEPVLVPSSRPIGTRDGTRYGPQGTNTTSSAIRDEITTVKQCTYCEQMTGLLDDLGRPRCSRCRLREAS